MMLNTIITSSSSQLLLLLISLNYLFLLISTLVIIVIRWKYFSIHNNFQHFQKQNNKTIGFFHPNCASGGGGERVLWKIIQALGELHEADELSVNVVIYTIDPVKDGYRNDVFQHVSSRFSINISKELPLVFIHLHGKGMETVTSGKMSLVAQTIETIKLAWRGLIQLKPDIYFDTTGCAFTFLVARILAGCHVAAYVHYPTISTDMLSLVWERRPTYNNNSKISSSLLYSYLKLIYYTIYAISYGAVGSLASLVLVNSTWTYNHIKSLWRLSGDKIILFPPCDTADLSSIEIDDTIKSEQFIVSIGQFRPEKDHELQIRSFALLLEMMKKESSKTLSPKLILIGGCRSKADTARVESLRQLAKDLKVLDSIEFVINQNYSVLKSWLARATIGLHTMWNEHFGIGVVEMMAAGLITIAHNSGGPKSDIIENGTTGYLASNSFEYATIMKRIFCDLEPNEILNIRQNARISSMRFSDQVFNEAFKRELLFSKVIR